MGYPERMTVSVRFSREDLELIDSLREGEDNKSDVFRKLLQGVRSRGLPRQEVRRTSREILLVEGMPGVEIMVSLRPNWERHLLHAFIDEDGTFFFRVTQEKTFSIHKSRLPDLPLTTTVIIDGITFMPSYDGE